MRCQGSNEKKAISGKQCTAALCHSLLSPTPTHDPERPSRSRNSYVHTYSSRKATGKTVPRAVHEDGVEVGFTRPAPSHLSFQDSPQGSYHLLISCLHHPALLHTSTHQISSKSRKWRGNQVSWGTHQERKKVAVMEIWEATAGLCPSAAD